MLKILKNVKNKNKAKNIAKNKGGDELILEIILIVAGFILLIKGADLLVSAAASIAKRFNLSEMLIGLTVVAIGTSLPEIFITITSSIDGHTDLIISNATGSCVCNFLFVIGLTSLIGTVKLDKRIINVHLPISIAAMVLILFLGNTKKLGEVGIISRGQGVVLLLCAIIYIFYTVYEEKKIKDKKLDEEIVKEVKEIEKKSKSIGRIILFIILGLLGLKSGSDFVVENSVLIASDLGFSESFIGATIVALGTALPEIVTGIISAKRGETDLLLGNITGSNIINLFLLIGLGASINPLMFDTEFNRSLLILIAVTIVLQLIGIFSKKSKVNRLTGAILILGYVLYVWSMV